MTDINWGQNCLDMESSSSNFDSERGKIPELEQEIGGSVDLRDRSSQH